MSNTVNIGNFSVECFHSVDSIGVGEVLDDYQNIILTLVPNQGYALDATNFSAPLPYPNYVSNVVFSQSTTNAANVLCTVSLIPGSVMPSNDIIIDLCIRGIATIADTSVSGTVTYAQAVNVLPATLFATYSAPGSTGQPQNVFTQVVSAVPGTYFVNTPTIAITNGNMADYSVSYSHVTNSSNQIISTTIEIFYTFGNSSVSGDSWEIAAAAFAPSLKVDSYSIDSSVIPESGDSRTYTVAGDAGAVYTLTSNKPIFSGSTTYNGIIPSTGSEAVTATFPAATSNEVYSITIAGIFSGSFNQPVTISLNQYVTITINYNTFTTRSIAVTPPSYSSSGLSGQVGTPVSISFDIVNNTGTSVVGISPINDINVLNLPEYPITFDGGGTSNVQKVTDVTNIVAGMSFYDSPLPDGITVQSVNAGTKEITFSDTITVVNNSTVALSLANNNKIFLLNNNIENDPVGSNNWTLTSEAYIQSFGWDDVTFSFDLDSILIVPDPPGSVSTVTGIPSTDPVLGDVLTAGGNNISDNGGTIERKGIQVLDITTPLAQAQFYDCNCGGGTADYTSVFPVVSGITYEYKAVVYSGGGSYGEGATLTYTHP